MAKVTFAFRDLDDDLIPEVCAKCGAGATIRKSKVFSWQPPWVGVLILFGLLPYIVVSLILTKRRPVNLPFCDAHKNHWSWRTLTILGSFLCIAAIGGITVALLANSGPGGSANDLAGFLCVATLVLLLAWLITAVVLQNSAIQASEITDCSISLRNVAREFADACEEELEGGYPRRVDRAVRDEWDRPDRRRAGPPDDKVRKPEPPRPTSDAYEPE